MKLSKLRILKILMLSILLINIVIPVQATSLDDIIAQGIDFISDGKKSQKDTFDGKSIKTATDTLYSLFFGVGVAIAVIVGAYLGIKFMTEGVEGKAKIKEALIPFVIGCMIIFGGFSIWKIAMNLFRDIEKVETSTSGTQQYYEEKCAAGTHSYDNYADKECNNSNCRHTCYHSMGSQNSSGVMKCTKGCGFSVVKCDSGYNGRTPGKHSCTISDTCDICGSKCKHLNMSFYGKQHHKCDDCGKTEKHIWAGGTCTVCGKQCTHQYKLNNGTVTCDKDCGFEEASCTRATQAGGLGRSQHDYSINWYGGLICSECHAPDPNNPPTN